MAEILGDNSVSMSTHWPEKSMATLIRRMEGGTKWNPMWGRLLYVAIGRILAGFFQGPYALPDVKQGLGGTKTYVRQRRDICSQRWTPCDGYRPRCNQNLYSQITISDSISKPLLPHYNVCASKNMWCVGSVQHHRKPALCLWPVYASWVWTVSSTIHQNLKGSTEEFCGGPCIQWLVWLVEMPWCCSRMLASFHLFPNLKNFLVLVYGRNGEYYWNFGSAFTCTNGWKKSSALNYILSLSS